MISQQWGHSPHRKEVFCNLNSQNNFPISFLPERGGIFHWQSDDCRAQPLSVVEEEKPMDTRRALGLSQPTKWYSKWTWGLLTLTHVEEHSLWWASPLERWNPKSCVSPAVLHYEQNMTTSFEWGLMVNRWAGKAKTTKCCLQKCSYVFCKPWLLFSLLSPCNS